MENITTIGIMFAGEGGEFPTVDALSRSHFSPFLQSFTTDTEPFSEWLAVAYDPTHQRYFDDDAEAMDETNWDAIRGHFDDLPNVQSNYTYSAADRGAVWITTGHEDAEDAGCAIVGHVLCVRADHDALDDMRKCSAALADYPLLDESAYSEREYEAWMDYAPQAFRDEVMDAERDGAIDEQTSEYLTDNADAILPLLGDHLHYFNGFSGEYGPDFLSIYRDGMRKALAAMG